MQGTQEDKARKWDCVYLSYGAAFKLVAFVLACGVEGKLTHIEILPLLKVSDRSSNFRSLF